MYSYVDEICGQERYIPLVYGENSWVTFLNHSIFSSTLQQINHQNVGLSSYISYIYKHANAIQYVTFLDSNCQSDMKYG